MKFSFSHFLVLAVTVVFLIPQASAQVVEIPDPNLRAVIRETLQIPAGEPITQQKITTLTDFYATGIPVNDLTGLEHAINVEYLNLSGTHISDISPLASLTNLKYLYLAGNRRITDISPLADLVKLETLNLSGQAVSDITPLVNLRNLTYLSLEKNYVTDISALGNLVNLQELWINQNPVVDFTPLKTLSIATLYADEICDFPVDFISTKQRIENRHFPSVFQAWDTVVGLDNLTWEQRNVLHDLHWNPTFNHAIYWDTTLTQSTYGLATNLGGTIWHARAIRQRRLDQNPNMIFLRDFVVHVNGNEFFPPNSDFWVRDAHGQIVKKPNGAGLIDFVKPEVQDLLIERLIGVAKCGLYDGIFIDGFGLHGIGFVGRHLNSSTDEDMIQAMFNILSKAREQIPEDFLIIVNTNELRPHIDYAEFINGIFMETGKDLSSGYSLARLRLIENSLSWAETNLREPRINCLEGEGMSIEPPDGPNNLRWMRLFTTLSLTHSDGYVLYTTGFRDLGGPHHDHLWHAFWDADLGRPVGTKAQQYQNTDGLFIREFTNGWAVYNRSEKAQTITLPASATPVSDRGNSAASQTHLLPDLDGEMYLKIKNPADVNGDWEVNVLDLIFVAQQFSE